MHSQRRNLFQFTGGFPTLSPTAHRWRLQVKMENISNGRSTNSSGCAGWRAEEAIAGNSKALQELRELISWPILYSQESAILGLKWPRGLLLYGPPGTGKTSLVRAVVRECDAHLIAISPHSVLRSHVGESEKVLREAFAEATSHAQSGKPCVIFIDEIDVLCPRRDSRREQDVRIASELGVQMDSNRSSSRSGSHVLVVASTNRVDSIDPALRRPGRFGTEIEVSIPNEDERFQILKLYSEKLRLDPNVDLQAIATSCNGYVGADLEALCREAVMSALNKVPDSKQCILIEMDDWKHARSVVGPSITRGVTMEIPKVFWDDIGGLKDLKKKLQRAVEWPLKRASEFSSLGVSPIRGILLHGPPGCSKTTLAKAAANAAQASFFSLSGAELYSMYVGEGEALLRSTFQKARLAAPSIIFFDEADVVGAKRGGSESGSTAVSEKLLSTLLNEMDGVEQAKGVLVLGATNRPYAIDAALMRPGRFDLVLYVPPPDLEGRHEILCVHTRNMKIANDVNLKQIAKDTDLFTGAELELLCREAGIVALREHISAKVVYNRHFQIVSRSLNPALTREEIASYASFLENPFLTGSNTPESKSDMPESRSEWKRRGVNGFLRLVASVGVGVISVVLYTSVPLSKSATRELART